MNPTSRLFAISLLLASVAQQAVAQSWTDITANLPATPKVGSGQSLASVGTDLFLIKNNGVLKSSDNGNTWTAMDGVSGNPNNLNTFGTRSINAIGSTVWVGGEPGSLAVTGGVVPLHKLTPPATSWTPSFAGTTIPPVVDVVAFDSSTNTHWAAAAQGGIFKSTDGGSTWVSANGNLPSVIAYSIVARNGKVIAAIIGNGMGAFTSTDGGVTWTNNGVPLPSIGFLTSVGDNVCVIGEGSTTLTSGVYFSKDFGLTWQFTQVDTAGGLKYLKNTCSDANTMFSGGTELSFSPTFVPTYTPKAAFSLNGGMTWDDIQATGLPVGVGKDVVRLARHSTFLFALTGENKLYRLDLGTVALTPTLKVAVAPKPAKTLVGGTLTMKVFAGGPGTLAYQWKKGSENVAGQTTDTLSIANAQVSDTGDYTCVVTAGAASVTSAAARGTVVARVDGRYDPSFDRTNMAPGETGTPFVQGDGSIVVITAGGVYKLGPNGGRTDARGIGGTTGYFARLLDSSGRILLGGIQGNNSTHRVRRLLNTTGFPDDTTFPQLSANATIRGIHELPGAGYLLWGDFSQLGSVGGALVNVPRLVLVNYDGSLNTTFNTNIQAIIGLGASATPLPLPDGTSWVSTAGGLLTRVNALGQKIAGHADYTVTTSETIINGSRVLKSGKLLVGLGNSGSSRPLKLFNTNGTFDTAFNTANLTLNNAVGIAAEQADGKIVVSGSFTAFGSNACDGRIMRINADGSFDSTFYNAAGFGSAGATGMAYDPRGYVYLVNENNNATTGGFQDAATMGDTIGRNVVRVFTTVEPLAIFNQSASQRVNFDGSVTLFVNAVGTSALSYQWFKGNGEISGATSSTYTINKFSASNNGSYSVRITNASGNTTSVPMVLAVLGAPEIVSGPVSLDKQVGTSHTFNVSAVGNPTLTYQWRKNGTAIPTATSNSLALSNLQLAAEGNYTVVVTNSLGSIESPVATLEVFEITGSPLPGFTFPAGTVDSLVTKLGLFSDGSVLLGGNFFTVGSQSHPHFTRVTATGSLVAGWFESTPGGVTSGTTVQEAIVLASGKSLVAGSFSQVQATARASLARINANGTLDSTFIVGGGPNSTVFAVGELPDRKLLVGGAFTHWNGQLRHGLAKLEENGSLDTTYSLFPNDRVLAIKTMLDGRAYLAGQFTQFSGQSRSRIVRLLADGTVDPAFNPPAINNSISDIALDEFGRVVIGGDFTTVGTATRLRVARLNTNGTLDTSFDAGTDINSTVHAVDVQHNGRILIGGAFTSFLKRLLSSGDADPRFVMSGGGGPNATVYDVKTTPDGKLWFSYQNPPYFGARTTDKASLAILQNLPESAFADLGGSTAFSVSVYSAFAATYQWLKDGVEIPNETGSSLNLTNLARTDAGSYTVRITNGSRVLTSTAAALTVLAEPVITTPPVSAASPEGGNATFSVNAIGKGTLTYQWRKNDVNINGANGPSLVLSGVQLAAAACYDVLITNTLGSVTSQPASLGVYVQSGAIDSTLNPGTGPNSTVTVATELPNGNIAIGGVFTSVAGQTRNRFAILSPTGSLVSLATNPSLPFQVNCIALQNDGKFIVGSLSGIQRFNADGTTDGTFPSIGDQVDAFAVRGTTLYVGGFFGHSSNCIRKFSLVDGSQDTAFQSNATALRGMSVNSIHVQSDGKVLVGDAFGTLVRLETTGATDTTFTSPTISFSGGANINIYAIAQTADGMIWIGGRFDGVNGSFNRRYLARLNSTGGLDSVVGDVLLNGDVRAIYPSGNDVIIGGSFTKFVNSQAFNYLLKVSGTNGAIDTTFGPLPFDSTVRAFSRASGGKLLVGGSFTNPSVYVARVLVEYLGSLAIVCPPESITVSAGEPAAFSVGWTGGGPATYQWKKNNIDLPGQTGQALKFDSVNAGNAGSYTVAVTSSGQTEVSAAAVLTIGGGTGTFAGWLTQFSFPVGQADPDDDPDSDEFTNLEEFAYGTNPLSGSGTQGPEAGVPAVIGPDTYPTIAFNRRTDATGITISVQADGTIPITGAYPTSLVSSTPLGGGLERVVYRSNVSVANDPSQFLRLRISSP